MMRNTNDMAEKTVQEERDWLNQVSEVSKRGLEKVPTGFAKRDLDFMLVCFLSKQIDHAETLHRILPHKDSMLIARSMFEGWAYLLWAIKKELASQWRTFVSVHDWRRLQSDLKRGISVSETRHRQVTDLMNEYDDAYRDPMKAKWKKPPEDPYYYNWRCGTSLASILRYLNVEELYAEYGLMSDWAHWGPGGFGSVLNHHGSEYTYHARDYWAAGLSVRLAMLSIVQTADLASEELALGISAELHGLRDDFARWCKSANSGEAQ